MRSDSPSGHGRARAAGPCPSRVGRVGHPGPLVESRRISRAANVWTPTRTGVYVRWVAPLPRLALILACAATTPLAAAALPGDAVGQNEPELPRVLPRHHVLSAHARQAPRVGPAAISRPPSMPSQPGDVIELQAGATFIGNFILPRKPGVDWIHIRSSAHARLPRPGTRVLPFACEPHAEDRYPEPDAGDQDCRWRAPLPLRRHRESRRGAPPGARGPTRTTTSSIWRPKAGRRPRARCPPTSSSTAATSTAPPPETSGAASP